ncbi:ABC-2 transporter permease [Williamsia sterculiae]|uniref:ABC-2 family transporter protein n=1 Tax=Williamsia sterculiae TaxID=1344003 RepID=A0A1N7H6H9_9NOCA|nr:hypothetical protein [Williamsia sterculiae]SIS20477.1 hypothetical protein SAMN05445060_3613 [Williamsia sterculiae]
MTMLAKSGTTSHAVVAPGSDGASGRAVNPRKLVALVVGVGILLGAMITAFALPAARSAPHHIPIAVVGSEAQSAQVGRQLPGFDVTAYPSVGAARTAIEHRDVYAAITVTGHDVTTTVASAASPTVATTVTGIGQKLAGATGKAAHNDDIRSFPAKDPKGTGLAAGALPLALGGWIGAMVIMLLLRGSGERLLAAAGVAVIGGLSAVAVLRFLVGTFDHGYWTTAGAGMLGIGATSMMVLGLRELFGSKGLAVAAVLLIFLGNPLSGLSSAPEMLPTPWGRIGQLLPPGATGSLLRDMSFFDGNAITGPIIVLACWLLGGLALYGIGARRAAATAG